MKLAVISYALLLGLAHLALADNDDQYRAHAALEAGEILPLDVIFQRVSDRVMGVPIDGEIGREDGLWVCEFEIRREDGRLVEVEVDAASGVILELEEYED